MKEFDGKRVLVVEDEALVAMMLEDMLSDRGAHVIAAATLAAALDLAGRERIDVALLDVNLNGERSTPVGAVLRQRGIPYVLATGYIAAECVDYEPTGLLQKPYLPAEFLAALRGAMPAG